MKPKAATKSQQRTQEPDTVWAYVVIRRERDLPNLLVAGDLIARQFFIGLAQWLKLWRDAAVPPLCLTCEHEFRFEAPPPDTFALLCSEDPRVRQVALSGVCSHCAAAKSDAELQSHGSKLICERMGGRSLGFGNFCPVSTTEQ
jgi:hypothetical protein